MPLKIVYLVFGGVGIDFALNDEIFNIIGQIGVEFISRMADNVFGHVFYFLDGVMNGQCIFVVD